MSHYNLEERCNIYRGIKSLPQNTEAEKSIKIQALVDFIEEEEDILVRATGLKRSGPLDAAKNALLNLQNPHVNQQGYAINLFAAATGSAETDVSLSGLNITG